MGMILDRFGRGFAMTLFANLLGCAILIAAAVAVHWFKNPPWQAERKASLG